MWNGEATRQISASTHHQNVDFNIFEGMVCHGVPEVVISRGNVVVDHGRINVVRGGGRFIPCPAYPEFVYSRIEQRDKVRCADSTYTSYTGNTHPCNICIPIGDIVT